MTMHRRSLITLPSIETSLRLWVNEGLSFGPHGCGAVFCPSEQDLDQYMQTAERVLPPYERERSTKWPVAYRIITSATLSLFSIDGVIDAAAVQEQWPFVIIHDPAAWGDPRSLRHLTTRLSPEIGRRTTLVTVGSPLDLPTVALDLFDDVSTVKEIDYSAITKALSS